MNFISYLKQPFPKLQSRWKLIILISLFVGLFLIIFQPFGINLMESTNKFLILSGYALVTFVTLFINLIVIENLFPNTFHEKRWTIGKEFSWLIWIIFSIGLGNAFYTNYLIHYFQFNFFFFVQFQLITLTVGVIPTTVLIITKQKYLLKKNLNSAGELNKSLDKEKNEKKRNTLIRFLADNEKDFVEFSTENFFFIEASGNYIELYIDEDGKIIQKTFRSTLKRALVFFKDTPEIIQCHRAFIVNTTKIKCAKGNSQGLRLILQNYNEEVPVSRGFVNKIRERINFTSS